MFSYRFWGLSLAYACGAALLIGIPTVLIPNGLFSRMTPTSLLDYIILLLSVVLIGPVLALATVYPPSSLPKGKNRSGTGRAMLATLLSFFSVGCPICNKIIVFLLGMGGAMTFFNPLRPFLGVASLVLLGVTLFLRVRVLTVGCPLPGTGIVLRRK